MELKKIIEKFEGIKILHQKFKQPEINYPQIKPAHNINEDILDQLKKSNEQIDKYQKANSQKTVALIILGVITLFVGVLGFYQTYKHYTSIQEIELLKKQLQGNASMLFQQSKVLDSLHYQVHTLEQSLQKDSLR